MFLKRFVTRFIIEIFPRGLNMDCKWPKLAFCSEIPLFYSFEVINIIVPGQQMQN